LSKFSSNYMIPSKSWTKVLHFLFHWCHTLDKWKFVEKTLYGTYIQDNCWLNVHYNPIKIFIILKNVLKLFNNQTVQLTTVACINLFFLSALNLTIGGHARFSRSCICSLKHHFADYCVNCKGPGQARDGPLVYQCCTRTQLLLHKSRVQN
jgi:hypothetical protein